MSIVPQKNKRTNAKKAVPKQAHIVPDFYVQFWVSYGGPFIYVYFHRELKGVKLRFFYSPIFEVRSQSTIVLGMLAPIIFGP